MLNRLKAMSMSIRAHDRAMAGGGCQGECLVDGGRCLHGDCRDLTLFEVIAIGAFWSAVLAGAVGVLLMMYGESIGSVISRII